MKISGEVKKWDGAEGVQASVWRSWAEHARPELLKMFNERSGDVMKGIRACYPGSIDLKSGEYRNLRKEIIDALNRLSQVIQAEADGSMLERVLEYDDNPEEKG